MPIFFAFGENYICGHLYIWPYPSVPEPFRQADEGPQDYGSLRQYIGLRSSHDPFDLLHNILIPKREMPSQG